MVTCWPPPHTQARVHARMSDADAASAPQTLAPRRHAHGRAENRTLQPSGFRRKRSQGGRLIGLEMRTQSGSGKDLVAACMPHMGACIHTHSRWDAHTSRGTHPAPNCEGPGWRALRCRVPRDHGWRGHSCIYVHGASVFEAPPSIVRWPSGQAIKQHAAASRAHTGMAMRARSCGKGSWVAMRRDLVRSNSHAHTHTHKRVGGAARQARPWVSP